MSWNNKEDTSNNAWLHRARWLW